MNRTPPETISSSGDVAPQQNFWRTPHALRLRVFAVLLVLDVFSIGLGFAMPCLWYGYRESLIGVFFVACAVYVAIGFNSGAFTFNPSRTMVIETGPAVRALLFTYGTLFLMSY